MSWSRVNPQSHFPESGKSLNLQGMAGAACSIWQSTGSICLANAPPSEPWASADGCSTKLSSETFVREKKTGVSFPDVIYKTACRIIPSAARVLFSAASSSMIDGFSYSKYNELWAYLYMPGRIRDTKQCTSLVTADSSLSEVIWVILLLISSTLVKRTEVAELF